MKTQDFLGLVGAPWAACNDHPDPETAAAIAFIRTAGSGYSENEIACIYNVDSEYCGAMRSAARDLIVKAPVMYAYVAKMAETGDTEAKMLLKAIHGEAE